MSILWKHPTDKPSNRHRLYTQLCRARKSGFNYTHTPVKMEAQVWSVSISLQLLGKSLAQCILCYGVPCQHCHIVCVSILVASPPHSKANSIIFLNATVKFFFLGLFYLVPYFCRQLQLLGYDNYVVDQTDCRVQTVVMLRITGV